MGNVRGEGGKGTLVRIIHDVRGLGRRVFGESGSFSSKGRHQTRGIFDPLLNGPVVQDTVIVTIGTSFPTTNIFPTVSTVERSLVENSGLVDSFGQGGVFPVVDIVYARACTRENTTTTTIAS